MTVGDRVGVTNGAAVNGQEVRGVALETEQGDACEQVLLSLGHVGRAEVVDCAVRDELDLEAGVLHGVLHYELADCVTGFTVEFSDELVGDGEATRAWNVRHTPSHVAFSGDQAVGGHALDTQRIVLVRVGSVELRAVGVGGEVACVGDTLVVGKVLGLDTVEAIGTPLTDDELRV